MGAARSCASKAAAEETVGVQQSKNSPDRSVAEAKTETRERDTPRWVVLFSWSTSTASAVFDLLCYRNHDHTALLCVFDLEAKPVRRGEDPVSIERAAPVPS